MTLFESDRLCVRKYIAADADDFFLLNSDKEVMKFIRPAKTREESDAFLLENLALYKEGSSIGRYAAIEKSSSKLIGSFSILYLTAKDGYHLGYALLPAFWGKGFATELIRGGLSYFFTHTTKTEAFAITEAENLASVKVLIKSGFAREGQVAEHGKMLELFFITKEQWQVLNRAEA